MGPSHSFAPRSSYLNFIFQPSLFAALSPLAQASVLTPRGEISAGLLSLARRVWYGSNGHATWTPTLSGIVGTTSTNAVIRRHGTRKASGCSMVGPSLFTQRVYRPFFNVPDRGGSPERLEGYIWTSTRSARLPSENLLTSLFYIPQGPTAWVLTYTCSFSGSDGSPTAQMASTRGQASRDGHF